MGKNLSRPPEALTREEVSEADLEYGGEGEVAGVEVAPVLPLGEHDGAADQVPDQHVNTRRRGDDHLSTIGEGKLTLIARTMELDSVRTK